MTLLRWIEWLSDGLDRVARAVVAVLIGAMSIILIAQVFFRYVLQNSLPWSEEIARYLFVWASLLGASIALRLRFHPGLTLLVDRLPVKYRAGVGVLAHGLVLVLLLVVAREGFLIGRMNAWQRSPAVGIPMTYPYAAVWVGALIMAVHVLRFLVHDMAMFAGKAAGADTGAGAPAGEERFSS
ncbi:MAG TPA: TRAP transporter small permease [Limnochordales bacterium]|nr:TRAP transporter small permease [Limnochordales bacterium]